MKIMTFLLLLCFGSTGWAQTAPDISAQQHFDNAQAAHESGDFDQAILELERSWRLEERAETLALRVRVLESMGEARLALDIIEQNREMLGSVPDIYLVEERLRETLRAKDVVVVPTPPIAERSTMNTIGPMLVGTAGLGLGVWSVLLLLPESCRVKTPSGACREVEESATALGVGLGIVAVGALAGAVYWWIAGAPDEPSALKPTEETP
jgi:hypothetical protein